MLRLDNEHSDVRPQERRVAGRRGAPWRGGRYVSHGGDADGASLFGAASREPPPPGVSSCTLPHALTTHESPLGNEEHAAQDHSLAAFSTLQTYSNYLKPINTYVSRSPECSYNSGHYPIPPHQRKVFLNLSKTQNLYSQLCGKRQMKFEILSTMTRSNIIQPTSPISESTTDIRVSSQKMGGLPTAGQTIN